MTEIEAKALDLIAQVIGAYHTTRLSGDAYEHVLRSPFVREALDRLTAASQEAAEARHAAEMRELKERFGEAAAKVVSYLNSICAGPTGMALRSELAPFIIPAPDMVSEWLSECSDGRVSDHTMTMLRLFHHWLSEKETRKIGDAGE